jgi:hypothetical protein
MLLREFGYVVETTGADSPFQNGAVEVYNGLIAVKVQTLLYMSGLPPKFWSAALLHTVYLHIRLVHLVTHKTPFEGHFGIKPELSYLKLFGAQVCVKRTGKRRSKLDCHDFTGIFLGYSATDQNIQYLDLMSGVVKSSHHAQFDEVWYLQHKQPLGPQLLYDLGLEVDDTFLSKSGPVEECLQAAPYPPPIPKGSLHLPKFNVPCECRQLHLPLRVTDATTTSHPLTASAAWISTQQILSDLVYLLGICLSDMATIYMSPDPYFNAFVEPINLRKVDFSHHWTADLKLFEWNGRLILGGVDLSTPALRIPRWGPQLWGATLIKVGDIPVSTVQKVHSALAASLDKHPSCPLLFAYPKILQDILHDGLPIMYSGDFSQATHDQLNDQWDYFTLSPRLK